VPHAFKLQKEFGSKGLVIVLVESQATQSPEDLRGFVLQNFMKYGSDDVFITRADSPFPNGSSGIPHAALVGVDGKLLMMGNPNGWGKKLEEALEPEFKKIKDGWGKSPEAKKARALMHGKGKLAEAHAHLVLSEPKVKDEAKEDFEQAKAELEAKYAALRDAVKGLKEQGRFLEAKEAATALQKAVKGKSEWETEVNPMVAEFATPELDKEVKLDKALAAIVKSIGDKRPTDDHEKKFKDLAKKNASSKVGPRAAEYAAACAWKDGATGGGIGTKDEPEKKDPGAPAKGGQ
jgi:hypothetical protein